MQGSAFWAVTFAVICPCSMADAETLVTVRHFKEPKSLTLTSETVTHVKEPESQIEREDLDAIKSLIAQAPPEEKRDVLKEIRHMGKGLCKRNPNHPKCKDDTFKEPAEAKPKAESEENNEKVIVQATTTTPAASKPYPETKPRKA